MILVSLTTGYIVSYITYLLSAHIPNYSREIRNENLLRKHYLWHYKSELVNSFSLLKHLYKEHDELQSHLSTIPEINDFFKGDDIFSKYNKLLIQELDNEGASYLFNQFKKLEVSANLLLAVSRSCSCNLSDKINQLLTPVWFKSFEVIYGELKNLQIVENNDVSQDKLDQYNSLRSQNLDFIIKMKDSIAQNFELCRNE